MIAAGFIENAPDQMFPEAMWCRLKPDIQFRPVSSELKVVHQLAQTYVLKLVWCRDTVEQVFFDDGAVFVIAHLRSIAGLVFVR